MLLNEKVVTPCNTDALYTRLLKIAKNNISRFTLNSKIIEIDKGINVYRNTKHKLNKLLISVLINMLRQRNLIKEDQDIRAVRLDADSRDIIENKLDFILANFLGHKTQLTEFSPYKSTILLRMNMIDFKLPISDDLKDALNLQVYNLFIDHLNTLLNNVNRSVKSKQYTVSVVREFNKILDESDKSFKFHGDYLIGSSAVIRFYVPNVNSDCNISLHFMIAKRYTNYYLYCDIDRTFNVYVSLNRTIQEKLSEKLSQLKRENLSIIELFDKVVEILKTTR